MSADTGHSCERRSYTRASTYRPFTSPPPAIAFAVSDRFGLQDMAIWPTTALLLAAVQLFSTQPTPVSPDQDIAMALFGK